MRTHPRMTLAALVALGFGLAAPLLSQAETSVAIEHHGKHHFTFYANHEIYFAPETKTYYWRQDGRWISGTELPPEDRAYVRSGGVEIDLDTDKPYERNDWVIAHYGHRHDHGDRDDDDQD